MTGQTDLPALLAAMEPVLTEDVWVFATLTPGVATPPGVTPLMTYAEAEGLTLIVRRDEAETAGLAHVFPSRRITLNIHSSLEAVGFLAALLPALAAAGIGVNPVSAFFHDHLFVPADRAEEALAILRRVATRAANG
ncbi:MAG: ACT domain-containing protein [Alphaproteobacteria bacterium]|nr:ACT domain-containing protein [Alphaproteobacteria bacterium]